MALLRWPLILDLEHLLSIPSQIHPLCLYLHDTTSSGEHKLRLCYLLFALQSDAMLSNSDYHILVRGAESTVLEHRFYGLRSVQGSPKQTATKTASVSEAGSHWLSCLQGGSYFWKDVFRSACFLQLQVYNCLTDEQTTPLFQSLRSEG